MNKFFFKYIKDYKYKKKNFKKRFKVFNRRNRIIFFDKSKIVDSLKSKFFFRYKFFTISKNIIFCRTIFRSFLNFLKKKYIERIKFFEKKKLNFFVKRRFIEKRFYFFKKKYVKNKVFFKFKLKKKNQLVYWKYISFFKKKKLYYFFNIFYKRKPFIFRRSKRKFIFFSKYNFTHSYSDLFLYKTFIFVFKNIKKLNKFLKGFFFLFFLIKKKKNFFINFMDILTNRSVINKLSSGFFFKRSLRKTFYAYNFLLKQIKFPLKTTKKRPKFFVNFSGPFLHGSFKKMIKGFLKDKKRFIKILRFNNIILKPHNGIRKKKRRRK